GSADSVLVSVPDVSQAPAPKALPATQYRITGTSIAAIKLKAGQVRRGSGGAVPAGQDPFGIGDPAFQHFQLGRVAALGSHALNALLHANQLLAQILHRLLDALGHVPTSRNWTTVFLCTMELLTGTSISMFYG